MNMLTRPRPRHWHMLALVSRSIGPYRPSTDWRAALCRAMAAIGWDAAGWGPWLERSRSGGYVISGVVRDGDASTGGRGAWEEAIGHSALWSSESAWIDEALSGITTSGRRSQITWAALPTHGGRR